MGKKQVQFQEPSANKHDVTLGQIEVDLNKEFKVDDWANDDFGANNNANAWGSWNTGNQHQPAH